MTIEVAKLKDMLQAEIAMDAWWRSLSEREKKAYLQAHPLSKYGKGGAGKKMNSGMSTQSRFHNHLLKHGFVKNGNSYVHKNGRKIRLGSGENHAHEIHITHKNGDVTTKKTNSAMRVARIIAHAAKRGDNYLKYEWERPKNYGKPGGKKPAAKNVPSKKVSSDSDEKKLSIKAHKLAEDELKRTKFTKTSPTLMDLYYKHLKRLSSGSPKKKSPTAKRADKVKSPTPKSAPSKGTKKHEVVVGPKDMPAVKSGAPKKTRRESDDW